MLIALLWLSSMPQVMATDFELTLSLPKQTGEYHNPYVAVWVENDKGKSVRTLLLWREGAKWLKDIRRWWRKVGRKDAEFVDGITSATRAAGEYQLTFNANTDKGVELAQGKYTLLIEVVRENGGRSIIKQAFVLDGSEQEFTLTPTSETGKSFFKIKE